MRKIYSLFLALLVSVVAFADLNPYAYALSSQLSADETTLTVNYSLNATATSVKVVVLNSETVVKTIDCTEKGLTKGAYTVEIPTTDFPKNANLTWRVDVTGNSVAKPTQESKMYNMYCPHGLAIDKDPNSDYFGRILVAEAMHAVKGKTNSAGEKYVATVGGAGLYTFRPDFTTDSICINGGLDFTRKLASNGYQPWRVKISEDGRIFVSSLDLNGVVVWELSKDLQTWNPVISGKNDATDYNIYDSESKFFAGLNVSMDVKGSGEDLKLLLYSTNKNGIAFNQSGYRLDEYALGTATKFVGTPTNIAAFNGKLGMVHTNAEVIYDGEGGYWFGASRSQNKEAEPNLVHINSNGEQDYYNYSADYYGGDGVLVHNGMLFKGKARTNASTGNFDVYTIGKDSEGKVTLTKKWAVVANGIGRNLNEFAVDYAENLYVVGNSNEKIIAYAMPYDGEVSTPAASRYAFQLQEEVAGTFYTLTLNVDETAGSVIGNNGQYLEGETATLTATANRGYKFASWTVGEETITENPLTITVNANTTVTANFEALAEYTVSATAENGTVAGAGKYFAGETVTLTATSAEGYHFVKWSNESVENPLTFTAEANVELTAIFEINVYNLTVSVNDPIKGAIDVTSGTYNYGTEVTLTATPAEGYELLAWSDRSTTETITLTMTADKAVSAYFVKSYVNEPEFKVEKVWENVNVPAATSNGYQAVGWDGVIYMQDKGNSVVKAITAETITEYSTSGAGQQIAVDEAGNLIVFNAYFASATPNSILIYKKGSTEGKVVAFTLKDPAACHFFSASGDIFSAEGGYIYFYCNGKTFINRLKITNGAAADEDVVTDVLGSIYSGGTQNHVMVDIWGNLVAHARSNAVNYINAVTGESKAFTLPSIKMGTLGGCSFELAGKEFWAYHAGATNYSSEWNLYNMTDGEFVSEEDFYLVDKSATTNYAANWLNVQVIDEKTAYIYQFCPLKGAGVWKVTANFPKPNTPEILFDEEVATVYINASEGNAVIYYDWTIDAEVAVGEETKYTEPIALDPSTAATYQIEAIAILDGEMSDIATATFEIKANGETVNLESVGALAVVYSHDGNLYVQTEVGTLIEVYTVQGQRIYAAEAITDVTTIELDETVVLVRIADQTVKAYIKK